MESRLVRGGRNILDTYNERQIELEKKLGEIAERKKREVEMQQQLELQEETTIEIRETLTSVQQEVDLKTRKLKKCYAKYMVSALVEPCDSIAMANMSISLENKNVILICDYDFIGFETRIGRHTRRAQSRTKGIGNVAKRINQVSQMWNIRRGGCSTYISEMQWNFLLLSFSES